MNKQLRTWAAVGLLACAAGCSKPETVREAGDTADLFAYRCNYGSSNHLHTGVSKFRSACFAPRSSETGGLVRIPIDAETFETRCAVTIKTSHVALASSACSPSDTTIPLPILANDVISIDKDPATGSFALTRLRGPLVVALKQGTAAGGVPYLISEAIDGVVYAVYLDAAGVQDNGLSRKFEKRYRIEMFDLKNATNADECRKHLPTFDSSTAVCPAGIQLYPFQTGTSTGGEPPPR